MEATTPQEPIDMKKLLLILLLLLAIGITKMFAQVKTIDDVFKSEVSVYSSVVAMESGTIIPDVLDAYIRGGEEDMDVAINKIDPTSYSGLDVYISDHPDNILAEIEEDEDAEFKNNKYASVVVDASGGYYLVMIFSYASYKP